MMIISDNINPKGKKSMQKFFIEDSFFGGEYITLLGDEARHIAYSLRMAKGDSITLSDMSGNEYNCIIEDFTKDSVSVRVLSENKALGEPPCEIILFQALAKGEKMDYIVQKATELGVTKIVPFESERCIAKSDKKGDVSKLERRKKIAKDAAGQCGRGKIPEILPTLSFKEALDMMEKAEISIFCYEAEGTLPVKELLPREVPREIAFMIGPEGGFSEKEAMQAKERKIHLAGLGKRILRTETASLYVLSSLSFYYEM